MASAGSEIALKAGKGGQEFVTLTHDSGAQAEIYLHGATLTRLTNAAGVDLIFLSNKSVFDGSKGIRGGIPVVWPQFGPGGPLQQHGFARNRKWSVSKLQHGTQETPAIAELTLEGVETADEWSGHFQLLYRVQLWDNRLNSSLQVRNLGTGEDASFWQHALQHTYYATPDVTQVRVHGLKGLTYLDKVAGGAEQKEEADTVSFDCNVDRIYLSRPCGEPLTMSHLGVAADGTGHSGQYTAVLNACCGMQVDGKSSDENADMVVWNPWVQWSLEKSDIGDDEYKTFFCAEPGKVVDKVILAAGEQWHLTQDVRWSLD